MQSVDAVSLPTRQLGNSNMRLTAIGFWRLGYRRRRVGYTPGGSQDDNDSIAAIHRALELGINWIDTARVYGLGHSEEVVGRAIEDAAGQKPLVFTKCSMAGHKDRSQISLAV